MATQLGKGSARIWASAAHRPDPALQRVGSLFSLSKNPPPPAGSRHRSPDFFLLSKYLKVYYKVCACARERERERNHPPYPRREGHSVLLYPLSPVRSDSGLACVSLKRLIQYSLCSVGHLGFSPLN